MTFGDKLKGLREAKGWSQKELSLRSGCPQQSIAHWEQGNRTPAVDSFHALCKALGVRCTAFDGCDFAEAEEKRGRGRPKKS